MEEEVNLGFTWVQFALRDSILANLKEKSLNNKRKENLESRARTRGQGLGGVYVYNLVCIFMLILGSSLLEP